eukprot:scaffold28677_cov112-Isochrysis_galbana.AAC.2
MRRARPALLRHHRVGGAPRPQISLCRRSRILYGTHATEERRAKQIRAAFNAGGTRSIRVTG